MQLRPLKMKIQNKHKNIMATVHKEASNTYGTLFVAASLMPKRVVLV
jgi:hypothetical protein